MKRKYFRSTTAELETIFRQNSDEPEVLRELLDELQHRNRPQAKLLHLQVRKRLESLSQPNQFPSPTETSDVLPKIQLEPPFGSTISPPHLPEPKAPVRRKYSKSVAVVPDTDVSPVPLIEPTFPGSRDAEPRRSSDIVPSDPQQVLKAWTALEVLSPQTFVRPEELAGGDRAAVALLGEPLPWERGEKSRPNFRLYYQVVVGSLKMEPSIEALLEKYSDLRPERPAARGDAALAILVLDRTGRLVATSGIAVSSFGWGVRTALTGSLSELPNWPAVEASLLPRLQEKLLGPRPKDDEQLEAWQSQPISRSAIDSAFAMLQAEFQLPDEFVQAPSFAIRSYVYFKDSSPPEPLLLNSFFLKDLGLALRMFAEGTAPENLRRYIGVSKPKRVANVLDDQAALESAVAPKATPLARWPSPGRHPLVLLQQAAVNLAASQDEESRLIGVNGPPGTGKTTLLRDVVADCVTRRARQMVKFDDPQDAFVHSGEKIKAGEGWIHLYRLKSSIRGYEMVVASSNNKAVENISKVLPELSAVASEVDDLRYFKSLSDNLHGSETWGLIAAALGRGKNRVEFKQKFWWDQDFGISTYLAAASGVQRFVEERDPRTGKTSQRLPKIVSTENPPKSHAEAIERWNRAREVFRAAKQRSRKWRDYLTAIRSECARHDQLVSAASQTKRKTEEAAAQLTAIVGKREDARKQETLAHAAAAAATESRSRHESRRPGFLCQLFRTAVFERWDGIRAKLDKEVERTTAAGRVATAQVRQLEESMRSVQKAANEAMSASKSAAKELSESTQRIDEARKRYGVKFVDEEYFAQGHDRLHLSTPWYPQDAQKCRDELFAAGIQLHRAFMDAAAKPLRHNLGALMSVFTGESFPTEKKQSLLPDLWATLFLVVPVVSTTFASVSRMLGRLPAESLGLLLVDEAGQALPQAAVGAIVRTQRAIFVGDPAQIEPVVTLPETMTAAICRELSVDADRYSAPTASAQTLADAASAFVATYPTEYGERDVGIPLLVHRRCEEPMFGISNSIAYCGLMVQSKEPRPSKIRDILGPSKWIDVRGAAEDKWCEAEGRALLAMLRSLAQSRVEPDLYVITPFVIVADRLRKLIVEERVLDGWVADDPWLWARERVGTIHTVQGREAEGVVLVLGATSANQGGARGWAGRRPNLLNVAVTRAKEVLYVIGNRELWKSAGVFQKLDSRFQD